ncbi:MAG: DivIVA domain-containing protein [Lachnospiraceae bacterium]|nr:DivIVA domain-containing protein [Lachnospira sp.]MBR6698158.1 DivIVA domain-containing protein [Lachnospiraceae bacterium]
MLTPLDIKNKSHKGGIGYAKKEMDAFLLELLTDYEVLYKANKELEDKVSILTNNITNYKSIEKTLQKSLILAQKAADETRAEAQAGAKVIEDEARFNAKKIVEDAKLELNNLNNQIEALAKQYEAFKIQIKQLANTQIDLVNSDNYKFNSQVMNVTATDINTAKKDIAATQTKKDTDFIELDAE